MYLSYSKTSTVKVSRYMYRYCLPELLLDLVPVQLAVPSDLVHLSAIDISELERQKSDHIVRGVSKVSSFTSVRPKENPTRNSKKVDDLLSTAKDLRAAAKQQQALTPAPAPGPRNKSPGPGRDSRAITPRTRDFRRRQSETDKKRFADRHKDKALPESASKKQQPKN
jgi:hypothetical protein